MTQFNAEWFYEEMKDALKFLGLGWGEMRELTVKVDNGTVTLSARGRSITTEVCPS